MQSFRPYQVLRRLDDAPYLPCEYASGGILCICPPLWFYIMNPKLEAVLAYDQGKPGKAEVTWNNMQEPTEKDKWHGFILKLYLGTVQTCIILAACWYYYGVLYAGK